MQEHHDRTGLAGRTEVHLLPRRPDIAPLDHGVRDRPDERGADPGAGGGWGRRTGHTDSPMRRPKASAGVTAMPPQKARPLVAPMPIASPAANSPSMVVPSDRRTASRLSTLNPPNVQSTAGEVRIAK